MLDNATPMDRLTYGKQGPIHCVNHCYPAAGWSPFVPGRIQANLIAGPVYPAVAADASQGRLYAVRARVGQPQRGARDDHDHCRAEREQPQDPGASRLAASASATTGKHYAGIMRGWNQEDTGQYGLDSAIYDLLSKEISASKIQALAGRRISVLDAEGPEAGTNSGEVDRHRSSQGGDDCGDGQGDRCGFDPGHGNQGKGNGDDDNRLHIPLRKERGERSAPPDWGGNAGVRDSVDGQRHHDRRQASGQAQRCQEHDTPPQAREVAGTSCPSQPTAGEKPGHRHSGEHEAYHPDAGLLSEVEAGGRPCLGRHEPWRGGKSPDEGGVPEERPQAYGEDDAGSSGGGQQSAPSRDPWRSPPAALLPGVGPVPDPDREGHEGQGDQPDPHREQANGCRAQAVGCESLIEGSRQFDNGAYG